MSEGLKRYRYTFARLVVLETEVLARSVDKALEAGSGLESDGTIGLEIVPETNKLATVGCEVKRVEDYEHISEAREEVSDGQPE